MRAAIIGGGAAGMYAAVMLAQAGHSVTIYEKNEKLGKKLFNDLNDIFQLSDLLFDLR